MSKKTSDSNSDNNVKAEIRDLLRLLHNADDPVELILWWHTKQLAQEKEEVGG